MKDVKARLAQAATRCGRLRNILDAEEIDLPLKIKLYETAVCSLLTYGCETWNLDKDTIRTINGANSRMLARFTGKSIPQEARPATTSFNLIRRIKQRRLRWVGHIIRTDSSRITYQELLQQHRMNKEDNLLTDAPPFISFDDLARQVMDRAAWSEHVNSLPYYF